MRRVFRVGGDLDSILLFQPDADIKRGDIVGTDDLRRVTRVREERSIDGSVMYCKADLELLADYEERQRLLNRVPISQEDEREAAANLAML
jgi:hypothetical protein